MANSAILVWDAPKNASVSALKQTLGYSLSTNANITAPANLSNKIVKTVPLLDDVVFKSGSSFKSASSIVSGTGDVQNLLGLAAAASGTTPQITNYFDLQIWSKTNPLSFDLEAVFWAKTSPIDDVLIPVLSLMSLTALTDNGDGTFDVPGISLATIKDFINNQNNASSAAIRQDILDGQTSSKKGKTIAIKIPGIISLPSAIITNVTPTFSKELTEDGTPLWAKCSMYVESVLPVSDTMLVAEAMARNSSILNKVASYFG